MKSLQKKIVWVLVENDEQTSYGLSKLIKKSIPSVEYALLNLVNAGVVLSRIDNGKTLYNIHPFFKDSEAISEVGNRIVEILKIVEKTGAPPTLDGYVIILKSIIDSMDIKDSY